MRVTDATLARELECEGLCCVWWRQRRVFEEALRPSLTTQELKAVMRSYCPTLRSHYRI